MLGKKLAPLVLGSVMAFSGFSNSSFNHSSLPDTTLKFDIEDVIFLEQNYGLKGSRRAKRKFNRIYNNISDDFLPKNDYTLNDAKTFFLLVANELKSNNIFPSNNYFITPELAEKNSYLDCDNFSLLYVSIASRLGLPVTPVYVKNHVFVRWNFEDGTYYNWDSRAGTHKEDSYYENFFGASKQTKESGMYLSSVSLDEALAPLYVDFAIKEYEDGDFLDALFFTNEALSLDSSFINAYFHKAKILEAKDDFEGAINSYDLARTLDSLDTRYYFRKGALLIKEKHFSQAISTLEQLLELDNMELDAIPILIDANLSLGNVDKAKKLYEDLYDVGVIEANRYILDARKIFKKHSINWDF